MAGSTTTCQRCGKGYMGASCPFCTVTGVDLEALLNAEEMKLLRSEVDASPVSLVDMVSGKSYPVVTPLCKVGRDLGNDIALSGDRSMSRFHCQITHNGIDYLIEDCGSRNGTFLNGSPIATSRKLQNGDIMSAGVSRYRFTVKSIDELSAIDLMPNTPVEEPSLESGATTEFVSDGVPTSAVTPEQINEAREALQKLRGTVEEPENDGWQEATPPAAPAQQSKPVPEKDKPSSAPSLPPPPKPRSAPATAALPPRPTPRSAMAAAMFGDGVLPAWMEEFSMPELQKLMHEKERLNGLLEEIRQDIHQIDRRIAAMQGVSQALLSAGGPELGHACKQVFEAVEWHTDISPNNPFELSLKREGKIEAVIRVIVCNGDPNQKDFEALVNQQAVVWCQHNHEPKGIMVVQVSPNLAPKDRPYLTQEFLENMRRKKICVVQPTQLLAMFRLASQTGADKNYFKQMLITTSGALPGFVMKPQEAQAQNQPTPTV